MSEFVSELSDNRLVDELSRELSDDDGLWCACRVHLVSCGECGDLERWVGWE